MEPRRLTLAVDLDILLYISAATTTGGQEPDPYPAPSFNFHSCSGSQNAPSPSADARGGTCLPEGEQQSPASTAAGERTHHAWLRPGARRFLLAMQPHVDTVLLMRQSSPACCCAAAGAAATGVGSGVTGDRVGDTHGHCCCCGEGTSADGGGGAGLGATAGTACPCALLPAVLRNLDPDGQFFGGRVVRLQDPASSPAAAASSGAAAARAGVCANFEGLSQLTNSLKKGKGACRLAVVTAVDRERFGALSEHVIMCQPYRKEYGMYDDMLDCLASLVTGSLLAGEQTPAVLRRLGLLHSRLQPSPVMQALQAQAMLRAAAARRRSCTDAALAEAGADCGGGDDDHCRRRQERRRKQHDLLQQPGDGVHQRRRKQDPAPASLSASLSAPLPRPLSHLLVLAPALDEEWSSSPSPQAAQARCSPLRQPAGRSPRPQLPQSPAFASPEGRLPEAGSPAAGGRCERASPSRRRRTSPSALSLSLAHLPSIPELPMLENPELQEPQQASAPETPHQAALSAPLPVLRSPWGPSRCASPPSPHPAGASGATSHGRRMAWDGLSVGEVVGPAPPDEPSPAAQPHQSQPLGEAVAPCGAILSSAGGGGGGGGSSGAVRRPSPSTWSFLRGSELQGWRPRSFPSAAKPPVTRHVSGSALSAGKADSPCGGGGSRSRSRSANGFTPGPQALALEAEAGTSPLAAAASAMAATTSHLLALLLGARERRRCRPVHGSSDHAVERGGAGAAVPASYAASDAGAAGRDGRAAGGGDRGGGGDPRTAEDGCDGAWEDVLASPQLTGDSHLPRSHARSTSLLSPRPGVAAAADPISAMGSSPPQSVQCLSRLMCRVLRPSLSSPRRSLDSRRGQVSAVDTELLPARANSQSSPGHAGGTTDMCARPVACGIEGHDGGGGGGVASRQARQQPAAEMPEVDHTHLRLRVTETQVGAAGSSVACL